MPLASGAEATHRRYPRTRSGGGGAVVLSARGGTRTRKPPRGQRLLRAPLLPVSPPGQGDGSPVSCSVFSKTALKKYEDRNYPAGTVSIVTSTQSTPSL